MQLQQAGMSVLEYASKFIELSYFASAFVAGENLKMNWFEAGLYPTIKERMSICQLDLQMGHSGQVQAGS